MSQAIMIRPMLGDNKPITVEQIQAHLTEAGYLIMQPKIDGMRSWFWEGIPRTRSGKEHKNKYLRQFCLDHPSLHGLDGEVVSGHVYDEGSFRESMSGIRAEEGSPEFTLFGFDVVNFEHSYKTYNERLALVESLFSKFPPTVNRGDYNARLVLCPSKIVRTMAEIDAYEEELLAAGWEGAMLRRNDREYKYNRSTNRGGHLMKLKRYIDAEAIVTGYEARQRNDNEATQSPLGYTTRSAHKDNLVDLPMLGVLHAELLTDRSVKFSVGVFRGLTHSDLEALWLVRESLPGRIFTFKHQGYGGGYDRPRTPVWLNWRSATEF